MKNKKIFLKLFPQSFAIDEVLSKKLLEAQDYQLAELNHPILYRGDTRGPEIIFKDGFKRRALNKPWITRDNESKNCVACTKDLIYAVGFADEYLTGDADRADKEEYGWVYAIHTKKGIDLSADTKQRNKYGFNAAKLVNEVTLIRVPKENIIAALQIKTTEYNKINDYFNKNYAADERNKNRIAWQILVTDLKINPACTLQLENPKLYSDVLAEFTVLKNTGYYRIPWSPFPEECNPKNINIHLLNSFQKNAFQKGYVASTEEAKKIIQPEQVQALELGLSRNKIIPEHNWMVLKSYINLIKSGCPLNIVEKCNPDEAYEISKMIKLLKSEGLNKCQIDGILFGFTKKEVTSSWFTEDMNKLVSTDKENLKIIREIHTPTVNHAKLFYHDNHHKNDSVKQNDLFYRYYNKN